MSDRHIRRREMLQFSTAIVSGAAGLGALAAGSNSSLASLLTVAPPVGSNSALPNDRRLGDLKDLNGYFPFDPPKSAEEWSVRREYVQRQILVACGLWPMPPRPAIEATVYGRVERDGYTIDRVFFESSPGFLVCGSLYRPAGATGRLPTILCPHGHWGGGRFHDHGENQLKEEIKSGAEQFEVGGRHPLQARCVQLARMGCMVFIYDMLGYADGGSLPESVAHRFNKQRPHLSSPERWGIFSAQSELRLINVLGLQTWNSIRILDWLTSRDDCDTARVGVTGASGGGSQTFLVTAVDDRVKAAFPAVMVSTAMQGGCTCENASYLRVNTGNIEFAAMVAPRPIYMSGANDWTVDIETKGLPELKQFYEMLGIPDLVHAKHFNFPHNYNAQSRMMMYRFFNRFLNLGFADDAIVEKDYLPLTRQEATVFTDEHPAPKQDEDAELRFLRAWDEISAKQIADLAPTSADKLKEFRRVIGGALEIMIGRGIPAAGAIAYEKLTEDEKDGFVQYSARLRLAEHGEEVPGMFLHPTTWNQQVVLWIDGGGKSKIFAADGKLIPPVAALVAKGFAVGAIDLLYTGEYTEDGQPLKQARIVNNTREFAGFTLGYNHPLFSQRVHDVLTLLSFAVHHPEQPRAIHVVGVNGAAAIAAAACAVSGGAASSLSVDTEGFRFAAITDIRDVNLLPGAVRYGDVPGILALCAPAKLCIVSENPETIALATTAYKTSGVPIRFANAAGELTKWLA